MKWFLSIALVCLCLFINAKDQVIVVIDPGHGGKDHGRLASKEGFLPEKGLNLKIAKKLGDYIESNLNNVKVYYTRTDDTYPSLDDRVKFANDLKADYFISVHCNGAEDNSSAYGTETHIDSYNSKNAYTLAKRIEKQFSTRAGRKSRGIKTSDDRHHSLQVLKQTNMPSVLVEAGFMSNANEEAYLNSQYGQEIIASAVFRAFREHIKKDHPSINFNKEDSSEEEGPFYRVQIMSSIEKVDTDIPEFKKLGEEVTRIEVSSKSMYKYKYTIGRSKDKKDIKKLLKKAKDNGFPDAYIVKY